MEKLPDELKKLKGSYREGRERTGLDAGAKLTEVPPKSDSMSAGGGREWDRLAPVLVNREVLTLGDLRTLELCCETLATAGELENTIRREGFTLPAGSGGQKAHPALKALETTRNAAHRMLSDFGLSPKARKFVTKAPGAKAGGKFAKWARGQEVDPHEFDFLDE